MRILSWAWLPAIAAAVRASAASSISASARWQPRRASETAIARPMPPAAPVTTAVRPLSFNTIAAFHRSGTASFKKGPGAGPLEAGPAADLAADLVDLAADFRRNIPGKPPREQFDAQLAAFVDAIETGYAARNGI